MLQPFRFRMEPRDDLSTRTDFTYDIMSHLGKRASEAVQSSQELAGLRDVAKVLVSVKGSLSSVDVEIDIRPNPESQISDEDMERHRGDVGKVVQDSIRGSVTEVLQAAIRAARERM